MATIVLKFDHLKHKDKQDKPIYSMILERDRDSHSILDVSRRLKQLYVTGNKLTFAEEPF